MEAFVATSPISSEGRTVGVATLAWALAALLVAVSNASPISADEASNKPPLNSTLRRSTPSPSSKNLWLDPRLLIGLFSLWLHIATRPRRMRRKSHLARPQLATRAAR